jgi:hypothetical protein
LLDAKLTHGQGYISKKTCGLGRLICNKQTPEGWSLHKGRELDLSSLTGIQPLLGPDDANCCPAGSIGFSVSLQGRAFVLEDASVDVPEPEPADSTADPGQPPASRDE